MAESAEEEIAVVVNPASGREEPVLAVLNRGFRAHDRPWSIGVTLRDGDARRMARAARERGARVVAVYGGDGTVSEVAGELLGSDTALAILPGGTANSVAQELGVPVDLEAAVALACGAGAVERPIDVLRAGGRCSLLRIGVGADARMIQGADRERKDRMGWFAYLTSALAEIREPEIAEYRLRVDERVFSERAVCCIVANIGRIGRGDLRFSAAIDPFDGKLDVIVVREINLATLAARILGVEEEIGPAASPDAPLLHLQGRVAELEAVPPQGVQVDGDEDGLTPVTVELLPATLRVLLPDPARQENWA